MNNEQIKEIADKYDKLSCGFCSQEFYRKAIREALELQRNEIADWLCSQTYSETSQLAKVAEKIRNGEI